MERRTLEKVYGGWERVRVRTLPGRILPWPLREKKVDRRLWGGAVKVGEEINTFPERGERRRDEWIYVARQQVQTRPKKDHLDPSPREEKGRR